MDYQYKVDYPLIARRIKMARKRAGLTQEQLAEKIDISTNAVAKLENHLMTASLQTLVNIANVLHVDINEFLRKETDVEEISSQDAFLNSLISGLTPKDKDFIIHVINGLKLYHVSDGPEER
jgi:transcriptional regulator with XRE-family HTH domain